METPPQRSRHLSLAESLMASIRERPFDGHRGYEEEGGWWISLEESKVFAMDEEWWKETDSTLPVKIVEIPKDRKLWLYESGKMYLGSWKEILFGKGGKNRICEVGYGISLHILPTDRRGLCFVGNFYNGLKHGTGRTFWLNNSPIWESNSYKGSQIKNPNSREDSQGGGLPYEYVGRFLGNRKNDRYGIATLKDGTKKVGGWMDDVIVATNFWDHNYGYSSVSEHGVDWWTHHEPLVLPLSVSSPWTRSKSWTQRSQRNQRKEPPPVSKKSHTSTNQKATKRRKAESRARSRTVAPKTWSARTPVAARSRQTRVTVTPDSSSRLGNSNVSQPAPPVAQNQQMPVPDVSTSGSSDTISPYNNIGTAKLVWSTTSNAVRVRLKLKKWTNETAMNKVFEAARPVPRILKVIDEENDGIEGASFFDIQQNYCVKYEGIRYCFKDPIDKVS